MSWYGQGLVNLFSPSRAAARTLRVMLVEPGYTYDPDHSSVTAVTEITAVSGYVTGFSGSGRRTLASVAVTYDAANNRLQLDCEDIVWTALGAAGAPNIGGVLVYIQGTSDADSTPLLFQDTNNVQTNGQDVTWSTGSVIGRITIA